MNKRHTLRLQLLSNGYRPLPLLDKGIRIPGWTREDIDEEWLAQFARNGKFLNTGIRCDDLIAFDIDVLDEDLANEIEDFIESECGRTDLCRVGKWPKRLLLYRAAADMDRSARTGKYGGHQVELLATHGRQFAAFGKHPGTGDDYEWLDGPSPLNTLYGDLPELSPEGAMQCLNAIDDKLAATGLEKTSPGGRRGIEGVNQYDLTDDYAVALTTGEILSWGELRGRLDQRGVFGNLRRENGEWGDSDGVHFYIAAGVGEACIHDFARDTTHWDKRVNDALAGALPPAPAGGGMFADPHLSDLQENYVLLADKTVRSIEHPEHVYTVDGFALINAHRTIAAPTRNNPNATQPAVTAWIKDPATQRADKAALRPDYPNDVVVQAGKLRIFNTYAPPEHADRGGEVDTLLEFVEHLIPDARERDLFLDWHALKVSRPSLRLHGLIMVTETFGTGRGTWAQFLQRLFGPAYVCETPFKTLIGVGGQSDFNEFLSSSLITMVGEALESDDASGLWRKRHNAYEALKDVCDTTSQSIYIKRKYGRNSHEKMFSSILVASNHRDMLAIEPGDRRLIVLSNGETALTEAPDGLYERIHAWLRDARNIGAAQRWFEQRAAKAEYNPYGAPMMTPAKQYMVNLARSGVDQLFDMFVEQAKGAICTHYQWRAFAYKARIDADLNLPEMSHLDKSLLAVIGRRGRRIEGLPASGIKVDKRMVRPWVIKDFARWKQVSRGCTLNDEIRQELKKNGPVGGSVTELQER